MNSNNVLIKEHKNAGRFFEAAGVRSFVREEGHGEAVVCIHGVPTSSFLYRKLLPELAEEGYQGVAFDFPGMGLAERPEDFDYSWSGLGKWSTAATEALGLEKFHLVIHDIGGPVGLEMVAAHPERILSLTILNTLVINLPQFKKPWVMRPFQWNGVGELYLKTLQPALFQQLMYVQGVEDRSDFNYAEAQAYVHLLKGDDQGKAFLKIMKGFETTQQKETLYRNAVKNLQVPKQVIWGEKDTALTLAGFGLPIQAAMGIQELTKVSAKHFLQEDQSPLIAQRIREINTAKSTA